MRNNCRSSSRVCSELAPNHPALASDYARESVSIFPPLQVEKKTDENSFRKCLLCFSTAQKSKEVNPAARNRVVLEFDEYRPSKGHEEVERTKRHPGAPLPWLLPFPNYRPSSKRATDAVLNRFSNPNLQSPRLTNRPASFRNFHRHLHNLEKSVPNRADSVSTASFCGEKENACDATGGRGKGSQDCGAFDIAVGGGERERRQRRFRIRYRRLSQDSG